MRLTKVIAVIVLLGFIVVTPVFATPGIIDLTGLTNEQLAELKDTIASELIARDIPGGNRITPGAYLIGTAIKPGFYTFQSSDDESLYFHIFESKEDVNAFLYNKAPSVGYYFSELIQKGESVPILFEEGKVLFFSSGTGYLTRERPDWAP